jgi:hypothetical protein
MREGEGWRIGCSSLVAAILIFVAVSPSAAQDTRDQVWGEAEAGNGSLARLSQGTLSQETLSQETLSQETLSQETPRRPGGRRTMDPFALISRQSLLAYLEELTAIGAYSGWRLSTTSGEAEARAFVIDTLNEMRFLKSIGLDVTQQPFRTYLGVELRESRIELTIAGETYEVAADSLPGEREILSLALRFDTDGQVNDSDPDPVSVQGAPVLIGSAAALRTLSNADLRDRVVLIDYSVVDRSIMPRQDADALASELVAKDPAGIVLVVSFSNIQGESHGAFSTFLSSFSRVDETPTPPFLHVRIEDLAHLGITSWSDLDRIEAVTMTVDTDIYSPGSSGNVVARIPGIDSSAAVILGAHIDSPNTPGAFDNGSGSVTLLEVAKAINSARVRPQFDLYLTWFGSHERGVYGSASFAPANQELLDRTVAMLQTDCLSRPLDGFVAEIYVETWPYGRFGNPNTTWPDFLTGAAVEHGVSAYPIPYYGLGSDHGNFASNDVPNANMIYMDLDMPEVHYDGHLHDPYETVELATEVAGVLEDMARVALTAALQGHEAGNLRVTPTPDRRALLIASHTESQHMASSLIELGMTLAWYGFDLDIIPYGQEVTAFDLEDAELVIALPVHDFPCPDGDLSLYDEAWTQTEVDLLAGYVDVGGFLVLTNSAHRLKYFNYRYETNEDWDDANLLAERFGVTYYEGTVGDSAAVISAHPLVLGLSELLLVSDNAVPFTMTAGTTLAINLGRSMAGIVSHGSNGGEVLVLADLGMLNGRGEPDNFTLWENLAGYARAR